MNERIKAASALVSESPANISGRFSDRRGDGTLDESRGLEAEGVDALRIRELVRRAQAGDRDAFGEIYRTYQASIHRLAAASVGAAAEDVVAETFLRAWKGLPRYRYRGIPFVAWLYQIARHVAVDHLRARSRVRPFEKAPESASEDHSDERLDLMAAIAALPERQRKVIEMKYLLGMTNHEVAAALRTTTGAVNAKQWRALQALHKTLEEGR